MIANLCEALVDAPIDLDILLIKARGPHVGRLPHNARVIPLRAQHSLTSIWEVARYLRREQLLSPKVPGNFPNTGQGVLCAKGDYASVVGESTDMGSSRLDQQNIKIDGCINESLAEIGNHSLHTTLSGKGNQNRQFWPSHAVSPVESRYQTSTRQGVMAW